MNTKYEVIISYEVYKKSTGRLVDKGWSERRPLSLSTEEEKTPVERIRQMIDDTFPQR